ncbi:MAG: alcohol dehydrogenase catalytic domain-containing protein [Actinomycetota bacterium]|nr:alcohol dehydrogenase catalytic domain-containing protein [Actinomycetota bacterium]MDQ2955680.1 alcohol dehydrogenase catalytic domain-containing protein [Actinomycetota bacterium]
MRAILIEKFQQAPIVTELPEPAPAADGVVLRVRATGLCRSDWHGWQGHDPDIELPHVPGHELSGTIAELGSSVRGWQVGQRVAVPFICACGSCAQCRGGNQQVCTRQLQPGFNYWGSFAEYVAIPYAEVNLVPLPEQIEFDTAAALGCRFATSYRAVTAVGAVKPGEWLVVFGCGGVGLSAVMIAAAAGARVIAVDTNPAALALAMQHGAIEALPADAEIVDRIIDLTHGGADVTFDAIGAESVVQSALRSLRPRGRHVQIGLLPEPIRLDVSFLAFRELSWLGSHGLAAHDFPRMLELVGSGAVRADQLVTSTIGLDGVAGALEAMTSASPAGVTVIRPDQR